jgi:hypothetical protein
MDNHVLRRTLWVTTGDCRKGWSKWRNSRPWRLWNIRSLRARERPHSRRNTRLSKDEFSPFPSSHSIRPNLSPSPAIFFHLPISCFLVFSGCLQRLKIVLSGVVKIGVIHRYFDSILFHNSKLFSTSNDKGNIFNGFTLFPRDYYYRFLSLGRPRGTSPSIFTSIILST